MYLNEQVAIVGADVVGADVGEVGDRLGACVGLAEGDTVGPADGRALGAEDGLALGNVVGALLGFVVGEIVVGETVGLTVGLVELFVGAGVDGLVLGDTLGDTLGIAVVGAAVGAAVGLAVGVALGISLGAVWALTATRNCHHNANFISEATARACSKVVIRQEGKWCHALVASLCTTVLLPPLKPVVSELVADGFVVGAPSGVATVACKEFACIRLESLSDCTPFARGLSDAAFVKYKAPPPPTRSRRAETMNNLRAQRMSHCGQDNRELQLRVARASLQ